MSLIKKVFYLKNRVCYDEYGLVAGGNTDDGNVNFAFWKEAIGGKIIDSTDVVVPKFIVDGKEYFDVKPIGFRTNNYDAKWTYEFDNGVQIAVTQDRWYYRSDKISITPETSTYTIFKFGRVPHKIDSKYLPDDAFAQSDWDETDDTSPYYIMNKPQRPVIQYDGVNTLSLNGVSLDKMYTTEELLNILLDGCICYNNPTNLHDEYITDYKMEAYSTYITISGDFGDFANKSFTIRIATKTASDSSDSSVSS